MSLYRAFLELQCWEGLAQMQLSVRAQLVLLLI